MEKGFQAVLKQEFEINTVYGLLSCPPEIIKAPVQVFSPPTKLMKLKDRFSAV